MVGVLWNKLVIQHELIMSQVLGLTKIYNKCSYVNKDHHKKCKIYIDSWQK